MGTYDQIPKQEVTILNDSGAKYLSYDNAICLISKPCSLIPHFILKIRIMEQA